MKRCIDIVLSLAGLLLLLPLVLLVALAVRLSGPGPVLFSQRRVGRFGSQFRILKFRTMKCAAEQTGRLITVEGDRRITRVGRVLRRWKLDELPQLVNVLRGQMSLVGPRPEVEEYVHRFLDEYEPLLSLRPGLTHRAAIVFRHEEEILARAPDPERFYVEEIMPQKLAIYRAELDRDSLANDLRTIIDTVRAVALSATQNPEPLRAALAEAGGEARPRAEGTGGFREHLPPCRPEPRAETVSFTS